MIYSPIGDVSVEVEKYFESIDMCRKNLNEQGLGDLKTLLQALVTVGN